MNERALHRRPTSSYAQVAVPVPAEGPFTYSIPEQLGDLALPGMRVRVPFASRRLTGTVVATLQAPPGDLAAERIRPLVDCLDPLPLLSPVLLVLTRRLAESTMSSWGDAIRTAIPSGLAAVGRRRASLNVEGEAAARQMTPSSGGRLGRDRLLQTLYSAGPRGLKLSTLARRLGSDGLFALTYGLVVEGLVHVEDEWTEGVGGRWRRGVRPARHLSLQQVAAATARAPAQRRAVEVLWHRADGMTAEKLAQEAGCSPATVKVLVDRGLVETYRAPAAALEPRWTGDPDGSGSFELTTAQADAVSRIEAALRRGRPRPLMLHGVTGSGKTEVYLRAARLVLDEGRAAILLVPEIGLTPLLEHRARAVLGDRVAVLHSGLSAGQRLEAWWRARTGLVPVVIGPRSAVFAPLENVGLIVIDEEQDAAYKQDERPRYHGRDVALDRAGFEGAVAVMGSATPAVESYYRARKGAYEMVSLPSRVASRPLPQVSLVDMRQVWQESGRTLLSAELEEALADRLRCAEQAMLLLNRRGFAAALICRSCGGRLRCPDCAVSLTLHQRGRELRCHYCDYRTEVPSVCPHCGSEALHRLGFGTQRLQAALEQLFPRARIRRFDADETRKTGAHGRILSAFARRELDLLVGTQMLAKGHDFPGVTLVGVVGADASLGLPDFRAAERTFQLLTQMAGRAGRGEVAGEVILQAYQPDHYAIEAAVNHDYEGFYAREIEYRRRLQYPPFAGLVACVCRGNVLAAVKEEADCLAAAVRRVAGNGIRLLGPASPPLARLRGRHRLQLLLRGESLATVRGVLAQALELCRHEGKLPRDLKVDVDPLNLM